MDLKNRCIQIINTWNTKDLESVKTIYGTKAVFYDPMVGKEIKGDSLNH